ncbi:hypothetical protein B0H16DRAFT_1718507 [Mycena metata]|uniref:Uncharacterized protein n=1 Tax=Mycena metata TaxID=1033252 RepID=A0AAD7NJU4_9AGAR|nr:hypothetical protein B0H16DRAFT_1718507 [Mycena metata]
MASLETTTCCIRVIYPPRVNPFTVYSSCEAALIAPYNWHPGRHHQQFWTASGGIYASWELANRMALAADSEFDPEIRGHTTVIEALSYLAQVCEKFHGRCRERNWKRRCALPPVRSLDALLGPDLVSEKFFLLENGLITANSSRVVRTFPFVGGRVRVTSTFREALEAAAQLSHLAHTTAINLVYVLEHGGRVFTYMENINHLDEIVELQGNSKHDAWPPSLPHGKFGLVLATNFLCASPSLQFLDQNCLGHLGDDLNLEFMTYFGSRYVHFIVKVFHVMANHYIMVKFTLLNALQVLHQTAHSLLTSTQVLKT